MDMEDMIRSATETALHSVVLIKDSKNVDEYFSGTIIHKTKHHTFVLAARHLIGSSTTFTARFDSTKGSSEIQGELLRSTKRIAIMHFAGGGSSLRAINFKTDAIDFSDVITILPQDAETLFAVPGRIFHPSAAATTSEPKSVVENSSDFFFITCRYKDVSMSGKDRELCAPVCDLSAQLNGLVVTYSGGQSESEEDQYFVVKICMSVHALQKELLDMFPGEDWKSTLLEEALRRSKGEAPVAKRANQNRQHQWPRGPGSGSNY